MKFLYFVIWIWIFNVFSFHFAVYFQNPIGFQWRGTLCGRYQTCVGERAPLLTSSRYNHLIFSLGTCVDVDVDGVHVNRSCMSTWAVFTWAGITFPKDVSDRDPKRDWDRDLNYVRSHALQTPSQSRSGSAHCEVISHALMHGFSAHF